MKRTELDRWIATLVNDREAWMRCTPGCIECNGYGWHVSDGEHVERDDTCRVFENDDEASACAAFYLEHARSILEALAAGTIEPEDARRLARAMVGFETLAAMARRRAEQNAQASS
jgi:hypothetical protein